MYFKLSQGNHKIVFKEILQFKFLSILMSGICFKSAICVLELWCNELPCWEAVQNSAVAYKQEIKKVKMKMRSRSDTLPITFNKIVQCPVVQLYLLKLTVLN